MTSAEVSTMRCSTRHLTRNTFLLLQLIFIIALILLIKEADEKSKQITAQEEFTQGSLPSPDLLQDGGLISPLEPVAADGQKAPQEGELAPQEGVPAALDGGETVPKEAELVPPQEGVSVSDDNLGEPSQTNTEQEAELVPPQEGASVSDDNLGEPNQTNTEQNKDQENKVNQTNTEQEKNSTEPEQPAQEAPVAFETCPWPGQDGSKHDEPCGPADPIQNPWFPQGAGAGEVNLLELPCPPYSRHFRAPCWKEWVNITAEDIWKNSKYRHLHIEGKNISEKFERMEQFWGWRNKEPEKHWRVRCLPYYFIVGLPKCATTDLYVRINFHKEIREPFVKEPQWWETNRFKDQGYFNEPASIHDYLDLYDMAGLEFLAHQPKDKCNNPYFPSVTGDASTWTLTKNNWWRKLPENDANADEPKYVLAHYIRRLIPQAKIIVMMRDPAERLFSDYLFFQLGDKTPEAFHTWATKVVDIFKKCLSAKSLRACIYTVEDEVKDHLVIGLYYPFMSEWLSLFPRDQMLPIHFEKDYVQQQLPTMEKTVKFLGLRPYTEEELKWHYDRQTHNTRREEDRKVGSMLNTTRTLLDDFYRPYNQQLAELLKDDRFLWKH